ncbi:hypothetical protein MMC10_007424 [Thelotrema lepadinum]|nr:hypothetical protein [Thelotrema lepadinum]
MPLHLLGKKSWNVYNQTNIEKVKRDEAAAAAREEAEEQRMQEVDNERRMRILRGLPVDDLPEAGEDFTPNDRSTEAHGPSRERKRRRIAGEDDTDRDMRYAMEDRATVHDRASKDTLKLKSKSADAPIIDRTGNIDLFPAEARAASRKEKAKNPEKEAEDARKKREFEDQYTMRFSNAAGFKQSVDQKPWYYTSAGNETEAVTAKDAFGNEDPRRKERQKLKTASDDPMVAIQRGVQGVRKVEKERKQWKDERLAEVDDLIRLEKKEAKRHKRHHPVKGPPMSIGTTVGKAATRGIGIGTAIVVAIKIGAAVREEEKAILGIIQNRGR